jgi:predicted ATPase/DNA-binding SARP family transcriptional activator
MAGNVRVLVLGPTVVLRGGRPQELRGPAQRRILTVLAAAHGEPVSDDRLAALLWEGSPPASAAATLQSHVSRLRAALGDEGRRVLRRVGEGYALVLPPGALDADEAARLVAAVDGGDPRAAIEQLGAALALWRGRPYADAGDDDLAGIAPERARLTELREDAVEQRLALRLALGDAAAVVPELTARTARVPFRERGWELLVLALYRTGRQADALAALRRVRALLDRELGVAPGEELQRLEAAVLAQDPRLLVPRPAPEPAAPAPRPAVPGTVVRRPPTRFLGRTAELARLAEAVAAGPLVTVTGPGGVGKTRLVVELLAARREAGEDDDGPWFVRLSDVSGPGFVALSTAAALGLSGVRDDALAAVTAALAQRRGVLVVDNCEHVLEETAELVTAVLDAAPGMSVVATSREPLGVDGEVVLPLAPLADDAVPLLADRIAAVRPGWRPGEEEQAALEEIARALDGLPLALELAAARSRLLALPELAGHLHDSLTFAAKVGRGGLNPHATLAAAIDWSLHLLAPAERDLLLRLWPFDGGVTVDAAEAVHPVSSDVLSLLGALVSRSVLTADTSRTPTRFTLLETVRARCRQLDPDPAATRLAHARWVRALVADVDRAMQGPGAGPAARRMEAELPNLRAAVTHDLEVDPVEALRSATGLDWWWYQRGDVVEGLRWLDAALAAAPSAPAVLRSRAHTAVGALRALGGDLDGGLAALAEAETALAEAPADDPGLPAARALVTHYAALGHLFARDPAAAEATARANLPVVRDLGLGALEAAAHLVAGAAAAASGRREEGEAELREAVRTAEKVGHPWAAALAERLLGAFALEAGDAEEALALVRRAAARSAVESDAGGVLAALAVAASALGVLGRTSAAATLAAAVVVRAQRIRLTLELMSLDATPGLLDRLAEAGSDDDRRTGEAAGRSATLDELVSLAQ